MSKLLAVDLDGTLIRGDGEVEERDHAAIQALQRRGVAVAMVTGRLYPGARPIAELLGLVGPHVCVDGAVITAFPSDEEIVHAGISGNAATAVCTALASDGLASVAIVEGALVLDPRSLPFERHVRHMSPNIEHVADVLEHPGWGRRRGASAVFTIGLTEVVIAAERALRERPDVYVRRHDLPRSGASTLVVHARGVSKGAGVAWLARHYGCQLDEVVVIGDWHNDISMFEVAGCSFAMAGSPDEVCAAAHRVLDSNVRVGGGIAEAVTRVWPEIALP